MESISYLILNKLAKVGLYVVLVAVPFQKLKPLFPLPLINEWYSDSRPSGADLETNGGGWRAQSVSLFASALSMWKSGSFSLGKFLKSQMPVSVF